MQTTIIRSLITAVTLATGLIAPVPAEISRCPVSGPVDFVDTFGACRDSCERRHEGEDLFAEASIELVAVGNGTIIETDDVD
jgi:hypothetical protein